jgi:predicted DCC family thiol-disulfide oxidoreductase YuxK
MLSKMLFKEIDARQYAALRIIFGALALFTLIGLVGESTFYYSDDGWFPLKLAIEITNKKEWTLLHMITSPDGVSAFFTVAMLAAFSMMIGFYSRLSTWITFVCIVSLHSRNWLNTYGGDAVLRLMLFYIGLSPSGLRWSIDAVVRAFNQGSSKTIPATAPIWPLRLMQIQTVLIYFTTGLAKIHGGDWVNGNALGMVLLNPVFARFNFAWIQTSAVAAFALRMMTWTALAWEISFPLLVVANRWTRWLALAIGVGVHGGIAVLLQIHWFAYLMIATYLCFLPDGFFRGIGVVGRRWIRSHARLPRMRVIYDRSCDFCRRSVLLLSILDIFGRLDLIPSDDETRWKKFAPKLRKTDLDLALYATTGAETHPPSGMDAFCEIGRVVPALAPLRWLAYVPGVRSFGRRIYTSVASSRYCLLPEK